MATVTYGKSQPVVTAQATYQPAPTYQPTTQTTVYVNEQIIGDGGVVSPWFMS